MSNDTPQVIEIQLSNGDITLVDSIDCDLANHNWYYYVDAKNGVKYVTRNAKDSDQQQGKIYLHRVILQRILGRELKRNDFVDHIDHNGLNNQRSNLRLATNSQNQANQGLASHNTSGYKGVSWIKRDKKWRAQISVDGKAISLGHFDNPETAYAAYCEAAIKYHGEFANLGTQQKD